MAVPYSPETTGPVIEPVPRSEGVDEDEGCEDQPPTEQGWCELPLEDGGVEWYECEIVVVCAEGEEEEDEGWPEEDEGEYGDEEDWEEDWEDEDEGYDEDWDGGGGSGGDGESENQPCETSAEEIGQAFPSASTQARTELETAINNFGEDFGIDTKEELQHFLAQAGHESGGFSTLEENLEDYTVSNLLSVFGKYFSQTDPDKKDPDNYVGDEKKIANLVYGGRKDLGNESSGDGYKYRGRGIIQLTGRANYKAFTDFYQNEFNGTKDFVENPGLVSSDKEIAVISAMHFFKENVLDKIDIDENTSVYDVTKEINGGTNGLDDRKIHYQNVTDHITDCNK